MADKRKAPETPGGGPRRKRAAPTIDLKATEVADQRADDSDAAAQDLHAEERVEGQVEAQPETTPEPAQAAAPASSTTPETPEAAPEPAVAAAPEAAGEEQAMPEQEAAAPPPPPPPPPPRRGGFGASFSGGVIGALIVALLGAGAWYGGYIPSSSMEQSDAPARLAALEKQVQALQDRPPPKFDTSALDRSVAELTQRVSKLESDIGNLPPTDKAAAQKLAALDDTVKSLREEVSALGQRNDAIADVAEKAQQSAAAARTAVDELKQSVQNVASAQQRETPSVAPAALDALEKKVAALESELTNARQQLEGDIKTVRGEVSSAQDKIAKGMARDRAARLALSARALRNAVVSGEPYGAELAQALSLGADAETLAPLEAFAAKGVPSQNALADELGKLIPVMRKAAGAQETTGGILAKLQANAEKLVRITPVEAPAGNDPSDVLARIEAEAAREEVAKALADLAKLPENVRAPAKDWIAKAKARQAALDAAQSFAANTTRALSKG